MQIDQTGLQQKEEVALEVFNALPDEKRQRVINAAMSVFAAHGYRKASVADIAKAAGISKAMVFTYFGSKSGLYEYLSRLVMSVTLDTFQSAKSELLGVTDYFERISVSSRLKIKMMKAHLSILEFSASMYVERDPEVRPMIESLLAGAFKIRDEMLAANVGAHKFKDEEDIERVTKMTEWMASGCAADWKGKNADDLDGIMAIFDDCLNALKQHFYKEEYL
jgi:AcrR family transcriptional regulator